MKNILTLIVCPSHISLDVEILSNCFITAAKLGFTFYFTELNYAVIYLIQLKITLNFFNYTFSIHIQRQYTSERHLSKQVQFLLIIMVREKSLHTLGCSEYLSISPKQIASPGTLFALTFHQLRLIIAMEHQNISRYDFEDDFSIVK